MKKIERAKYLYLSILLLLQLTMACGLDDYVTTNTYVPVDLNPPDLECQNPQDWQGLIPSQSNKQDVLRILGPPDRVGHLAGQEFYEYDRTTGIGQDSLSHRIYFLEETVDRIEIVVADTDGNFHTVREAAEELGEELDVVFMAGDADTFGPDHVYVWAECGIALVAIPLDTLGADAFPSNDKQNQSLVSGGTQLRVRHPIHPEASIQPSPDPYHVVMFDSPEKRGCHVQLDADVVQ